MSDDIVFLLTVPHATCPLRPNPYDLNPHPCDTRALDAVRMLVRDLHPIRRRLFVCNTPRYPHDANRITGARLPMRRAYERVLAEHARTMTLDVHSFPPGMHDRDNDLHFMDDNPVQPWVHDFVDVVARRLPGLRVEFIPGSHMNDIVAKTKAAARPALLVEFSEKLTGDGMIRASRVIAEVALEFANTKRF
jgi:hypothetical protein